MPVRQSGNYTAYTGQPADQHTDYGAKAVIRFGWPGTLPSGIIVPFNDTSLPSGWEWFTSADGKMIVGAGSTYSIGSTGGSTNVSATSDEDSHLGSLAINYGLARVYPYDHPGAIYNDGAAKSHSHSITFDYWPDYQDLRLIRATSERENFPAKAIVLTHTNQNPDPANLSIMFEANRFLRANSSISTGGGAESNVSISTDGAHIHHTPDNYDDSGSSQYSYKQIEAGGHDHNDNFSSFSDAQNIKRTYLMAWTETNAFAGKGNMIAMWESLTPPAGWVLCDGNNRTLDLRDYFIVLSSSGNTGTQTGNNTATFTVTTQADGQHNHQGDYDTLDADTNLYHVNDYADHTHALATPTQSYTPPYYALVFIMKKLKKPAETTIQGNMVCADIDGHQDDGSGTYTGTPSALIERPDHVFKHIWCEILGAASGDIDVSTSGTFYNTNAYKFCHAITEPISARTELMRLAFQCRSRFFVSPYGKAKLIVRQTGQSSAHSIINAEIVEHSVSVERSPANDIINFFNLYFNLDFSKARAVNNCLAVKNFSDATSISRYGQKELKQTYEGGNVLLLDAVSDATMAEDVGDFILEWFKDVRKIVHFGVFLDNMETEPGDIIDITHALDSMSGFICEVLKIKHILGSAKSNRMDSLKISAIEN